MRETPTLTITRRQALLSGAAASLCMTDLAVASTAASEVISFAEFMALSRRLTAEPDLDTEVGALYWRALLQSGASSSALESLLSGTPTAEGRALEATILKQWYIGIYDRDGAQTVATYEEALMWPAMGFQQPPAYCGGALGYWSQPPAS